MVFESPVFAVRERYLSTLAQHGLPSSTRLCLIELQFPVCKMGQ